MPLDIGECVSSTTSPISRSSDSISVSLKDIRVSNLNNVILGLLNINSLRNKFQFLAEIIHGKIDILILTETKHLKEGLAWKE